MKEKIKEKGFIQIPLLIAIIIAVVLVSGATTGTILYRQGKLAPLLASVSQIFQGAEEPITAEPEEVKPGLDKEIEEAEQEAERVETEALKLEEEAEKLKQQAEIAKDETEKARLIAGAEKAKAEAEKARAEMEKLKAEQEIKRIEEEQQEAQRMAEEKQKQEDQEQRELEEKKTEEQERIANIEIVDEVLSQLVSETKQNADIFFQAKNKADNFIYTVRNTMNKYPNSFLIQQSGQQLINELNNVSFISGKLFDIENDRMETLYSFLGSGNIPSAEDFSTPITQYENYRNQYDFSNTKINSLMATFVANEKIALDEMVEDRQDELERKQKASQALNQLTIVIQGIDSQLAVLDDQIKEKEAEIEAEYDRLASMAIIERRVAQLIPELNSLINQWNSLLDMKEKVVTLRYKIDDYFNYGTPLSAEDRTFLLSLGISF